MSTTLQPRWIKHANLGDVSPLDYGGFFVYTDATGSGVGCNFPAI